VKGVAPGLIGFALATALTSFAASSAAQIDILSQDIAIDVSGEPGATALTIDANVQATAQANSMVFERPLLEITLATVDGQPVTVEPHPLYPEWASVLVFPAPLAAGAEAEIHLELAGMPNCTVAGYPGVFCRRSVDETVLTTAMPGVAWHLANLYEIDPFVATIAVRARDGHTVLAGAHDAESIEPGGDGTTTHHFVVDIATEYLAIYAGEADTVEVDGVRVIHHGAKHDADNVAFAAEVMGGVLPILEADYGELPIEGARIVVVPDDFGFGALGLLGTVFVNELVVGPADYLIEQGMAHELSHSWWGNLACSADPDEARFFGESFAEYAGWRALGELRSDAVRTAGMRMNAVWYMYRRPDDADVPIVSSAVNGSPAAIHVLYHKGPLVVRTLEEAVGEEAFVQALRAFVERGYGGLSLEAFAADILAASGYDAAADVEQWLRRTGFPRISVSSQVADDGVTLSFTTDDEFTLGLPVRLVFSDGRTIEERLELSPGTRDHALALDERPIAVEVDPRWTAVREITPAIVGDVTLDGEVDGADLVALAVAYGGQLPLGRRVDGAYDPLFDVDRDRAVGNADLELVRAAIAAR
jgi:hypothetical protein